MIIKKAFHGTPFSFKEFSNKNKGLNTGHSINDVGFHFSEKKSYAIVYSKLHEIENAELFKLISNRYPKGFEKFTPQIIEVSLKIKNPLKTSISKNINKTLINKAIKNGYDGIIAENKSAETMGREYVVFHTAQIDILKIKQLFNISKVKAQFKQINDGRTALFGVQVARKIIST